MTKKKNNIQKYLLISLVMLGCFMTVYAIIMSTDFLDGDKPLIIKSLNLKNRGYNLRFYYIPSNATNQSYVQLRKTFNENREEVYQNFERYQGVGESTLVKDSVLRVVLLDTMSYRHRKDTIFIKY